MLKRLGKVLLAVCALGVALGGWQVHAGFSQTPLVADDVPKFPTGG
jgi:hypothetical protein